MLSLTTSEELAESSSLSVGSSACGDAVQDQSLLEMDFLIGGLQTVKGSDNIDSILIALLAQKPSRGLGEEESSDNEDNTEDNLECNWKSPGQVVGTI